MKPQRQVLGDCVVATVLKRNKNRDQPLSIGDVVFWSDVTENVISSTRRFVYIKVFCWHAAYMFFLR